MKRNIFGMVNLRENSIQKISKSFKREIKNSILSNVRAKKKTNQSFQTTTTKKRSQLF